MSRAERESRGFRTAEIVQGKAGGTINDCWNQIGTLGKASCPNLEEFIHCRNCPVYSHEGRALLDRESPEDYLREWTALLAQPKTAVAPDRVSVIVFRLGKEWLALKTILFERIVSLKVIHSIPHRSDSILLGLANIRGELLLCASLAHILGIEPTTESEEVKRSPNTSRMIALRHTDERWVFPVGEVEGIVNFSAGNMEPVPTTVAKAPTVYSRGIFKFDDKRVAFLDEDLIFSTLRRSMHWQPTT